MTLTGALLHGYGVYFYLTDEGMTLGSNWTFEIATRFARLYHVLYLV